MTHALSMAGVDDPDVTCPAAVAIRNLQDNDFVDIRTRAVFVDFTVFHAVLERMCIVRIFFELPQGGGVQGAVDVDIINPYPYKRASDFVRFAAEMLVLLQVGRVLNIHLQIKMSSRLNLWGFCCWI